MSPESWQNVCPRCGWANSGAEPRCMKCGQPLRTSPGLLVAGQSSAAAHSPTATSRRVVQPGGFFPRLIALIIDACILGVITVPLVFLWVAQATSPAAAIAPATNPIADQVRALGGSALAGVSPARMTQLLELSVGIGILLLFYYVGSWTILGGSPGQLVMGLRIVDRSVRTLGFGRALFRYLMKGFFAFLAPISALMVAFGKDKRAIHDLLAGTYVIQYLDPTLAELDAALAPPAPMAPQPAPPAPPPEPPAVYAGVALAAAAVTSAAPAPPLAPEAPATPPQPSEPAMPLPVADAPVTPAPFAPGGSAFERYPEPATSPGPPEAPAAPVPADLPVFPTSDPGGLQPMAPPPPPPMAPAAPGAPVAPPGSTQPGQSSSPEPYPLPFAPPPPNPPDPTATTPGGDSPTP